MCVSVYVCYCTRKKTVWMWDSLSTCLFIIIMIIYYLFTHKTAASSLLCSMHVLVQLILYVWRNDWLTSEWMRVTFLLLFSAVAAATTYYYSSIIDISIKTFYVKFQHCIVTTSICFRKRQRIFTVHTYGRVCSPTRTVATQTVDTQNKTNENSLRIHKVIEDYNWMEIHFFMLILILNDFLGFKNNENFLFFSLNDLLMWIKWICSLERVMMYSKKFNHQQCVSYIFASLTLIRSISIQILKISHWIDIHKTHIHTIHIINVYTHTYT